MLYIFKEIVFNGYKDIFLDFLYVAAIICGILMLINIRISELLIDTSNSIPLAIILGISFNYSVNNILPYILANNNYDISNIIKVFTLSNDVELYHVTSKL